MLLLDSHSGIIALHSEMSRIILPRGNKFTDLFLCFEKYYRKVISVISLFSRIKCQTPVWTCSGCPEGSSRFMLKANRGGRTLPDSGGRLINLKKEVTNTPHGLQPLEIILAGRRGFEPRFTESESKKSIISTP
jgi:hypothetical protein